MEQAEEELEAQAAPQARTAKMARMERTANLHLLRHHRRRLHLHLHRLPHQLLLNWGMEEADL